MRILCKISVTKSGGTKKLSAKAGLHPDDEKFSFQARYLFPGTKHLRPPVDAAAGNYSILGMRSPFFIVALFIPADGFIAFDWVHVFAPGKIPPFYVPWSQSVSYLTWPLFVGLSMAGIAMATLKRSVHILSAVAVFLSSPVFWTIFLGQLEDPAADYTPLHPRGFRLSSNLWECPSQGLK